MSFCCKESDVCVCVCVFIALTTIPSAASLRLFKALCAYGIASLVWAAKFEGNLPSFLWRVAQIIATFL
jgi:hypothetical protein